MKNLTVSNVDESHPFRQWRQWKIPDTTLEIKGYSRAGDKTFFFIPQLKVCLDASLPEGQKGDYVLITHTHDDHISDIEYLSSRDEVQIYLPDSSKEYLENYIVARRCLNHSAPYNPAKRGKYYITGVKGGDVFYIGKKNEYQIKVVNCEHAIDCVGYAFSERKVRLKPEYEQIKAEMLAAGQQQEFGKLIGSKRMGGEEIEDVYWEPLFVYMGDTHASAFSKNPWLFEYPYIITECTFLTPDTIPLAEERRHTHWEHLKPFVMNNPKTTFVLIHFSLRYSDTTIIDFFEQETEANQNILLWTSPETLLPQQHQSKKA